MAIARVSSAERTPGGDKAQQPASGYPAPKVAVWVNHPAAGRALRGTRPDGGENQPVPSRADELEQTFEVWFT
jgi:hypothetical protein